MRIELPEHCASSEDANKIDLSRMLEHKDIILVVNATKNKLITNEFLDTLFDKLIETCDPYYAHMMFVVPIGWSHSTVSISHFVDRRNSATHCVSVTLEDDCIGVCLSAADLGLPYNGIAYAYSDCPAHGRIAKEQHNA